MKTLLYSAQEISEIVRSVGLDRLMDDVIEGIASACVHFEGSSYSIPTRAGFSYDQDDCKGLVEWMPIIRYGDRVVVKLVGYHPVNPQQFGLPTVISTIVTFDTRTGNAGSIVDATFLTSLRTGAASAVASRVLAAPESRTLGLIGAGAQAITQLHALSRCFSFDRVLIHDTDVVACNSFASRAAYAGISIPIEAVAVESICNDADIICTSTSIDVGAGPVFDDAGVKDCVHVNAVGSDFPGKTELPLSLLRRSLVCPDFPEQALSEGESQQLGREALGPSLVELVRESNRYSTYQDRPTVFDSTGWALEDLVAADILTTLGNEVGCGRQIDLACFADDPKNPYGFMDRYLQPKEQFRSASTRKV